MNETIPATPQTSLRADVIHLDHRVIGGKHVFTSPDVPELHISHADEATARADIQPALDALARTKARLAAKQEKARLIQAA